VRGIRHHGDNDVGALRNFLAALARLAACLRQIRGNGTHVVQINLVTAFDQIARHRGAHDTCADKPDFHGCIPFP
jgi:hypothetical protein